MFCNIVTKALKFAKGGKVSIKIHLIDKEVVIAVKDSGPGMTTEVQSQLFQLFESSMSTTQLNNRSGFGLGLSVAKTLIGSLGGRIDVNSALGEGTCMIIHVPLEVPVFLEEE